MEDTKETLMLDVLEEEELVKARLAVAVEWETVHLMKTQLADQAEQELKVTQAEAAEQDDVVEVMGLAVEEWEEITPMVSMTSLPHLTQAQEAEDLIQILLLGLVVQEYA
jgi:hypothetical protein